MSEQYNEYLEEHIGNVGKAYDWLLRHFPDISNKMNGSLLFDHDASKYGSEEYEAYDRYFYGKNRSYKVVQDFNYAWLHHIHHNPHHWQYWVLQHDDEPEEALEMPYWYVIEMICDWWSFSFKSGNLEDIFDWYEKHKDMKLHPDTRKLVEDILGKIRKELGKEKEEAEDHLEHHGIMGQKWGVKNGPPYPINGFSSPEELSDHMRNFTYKEYDRLMSPDDVETTKSGSCHDQVMYEMRELRRMGKSPKGLFVIENDGEQGGITHSLVFYKDGENYIWFENAWGGREGLRKFKSVDAIKREIMRFHKNGEFGDADRFNKLEFSEFNDSDHKIGEDLQEFVDRCLG